MYTIIDKLFARFARRKFAAHTPKTLVCYGCEITGAQYMKAGACFVSRHCILSAWKHGDRDPELIIGNGVNLGEYTHVTVAHRVVIGDGVLTGRWVTISDNNHGSFTPEQLAIPPMQRPISVKGEVVIGRNVWIGDKATILSGVHIGEGSIVAANTVVTKDVPPFSLVAGNPGKIIKTTEK